MAHCLEWDDANMVVEALPAAGWEERQISGFQDFQDVYESLQREWKVVGEVPNLYSREIPVRSVPHLLF